MRIPSSVFAVGRYLVAFSMIAGSLALMSAPKKAVFTKHDKAFYADPNVVAFVRPGLQISISSVKVASDGKTQDLSIGYTDVWVWKANRWQMTAWRSAKDPAPAAPPVPMPPSTPQVN